MLLAYAGAACGSCMKHLVWKPALLWRGHGLPCTPHSAPYLGSVQTGCSCSGTNVALDLIASLPPVNAGKVHTDGPGTMCAMWAAGAIWQGFANAGPQSFPVMLYASFPVML